jgi:tetratricopeptide (TPR) repeat protein
MKRYYCIVLLFVIGCTKLFAQGNELLLAKQYSDNGENDKALAIYQKLYKDDNEAYYTYYVNGLITAKKFEEAEAITKKIIRKYPTVRKYAITLGSIYSKQGDTTKASNVYDDLVKGLPADQSEITILATQFYQANNTNYAIKTFLQGRKSLHNDNLFSNELITLYRNKRDKVNLTNEFLNFLPLNPEYIFQAENTMATLFEGEADYEMLRAALLQKIQKNPQQTVFVNLLIWQYMQQKDFDQALNQALALSRRTPNDDGSTLFDLCSTLVTNGAYDTAIRGYEYLISKGKEQPYYVSAKIQLIDTKNLKITSGKYVQADLLGLEKDYFDLLAEFGRTPNTVYAVQKLANLQAFKLHKPAEAQKLLEEATAIPGLTQQVLAGIKVDLGDVELLNGLPWEATLLYSQVEKDFSNTPLAQDAKLKNAKLAYYIGDFTWAKGQLDVLKASTTQLIANDALNLSLLITDNLAIDSAGNALKIYARADLQIFAEQPEKAITVLDSIDVKYPGNALGTDILMSKARILLQQKNYTDAIVLLKKILEQPTDLWADDAVYMLGDIYDNNLNDKEQAKTYYQKIITDYPGSLWINDARKRFRQLRGDKVDSGI